MSIDNTTVQTVSNRTNEITLEYTNRPYFADINQVCSVDGFYRFGVTASKVDNCVIKLMSAIEGFSSDEVVVAFGVAFLLLVRRFQFHVPDYLQLAHNFLQADDIKLGCHALQRMFGSYLKDRLTRYNRVEFDRPRTVRF